MRALALWVGNPTTRRPGPNTMHAVRLVVDGTPRGRQVMTMTEARQYAAILSRGCQILDVDFTTSFPAVPMRPLTSGAAP